MFMIRSPRLAHAIPCPAAVIAASRSHPSAIINPKASPVARSAPLVWPIDSIRLMALDHRRTSHAQSRGGLRRQGSVDGPQQRQHLKARLARGGKPEQVGGQQGGPFGDPSQCPAGDPCRSVRPAGGTQPDEQAGQHVVAARGEPAAEADQPIHGPVQ